MALPISGAAAVYERMRESYTHAEAQSFMRCLYPVTDDSSQAETQCSGQSADDFLALDEEGRQKTVREFMSARHRLTGGTK